MVAQQFTLALNVSESFLFLHRPYFARALHERKPDPTQTEFGQSYLSVIERCNVSCQRLLLLAMLTKGHDPDMCHYLPAPPKCHFAPLVLLGKLHTATRADIAVSCLQCGSMHGNACTSRSSEYAGLVCPILDRLCYQSVHQHRSKSLNDTLGQKFGVAFAHPAACQLPHRCCIFLSARLSVSTIR